MNEQGLGQMMAPQQGPSMEDVEKVAMMLQQGMDPKELMAQGVPVELIEAAIQMLQAEQSGPSGQVPSEEAGLANALMAQGRM